MKSERVVSAVSSVPIFDIKLDFSGIKKWYFKVKSFQQFTWKSFVVQVQLMSDRNTGLRIKIEILS